MDAKQDRNLNLYEAKSNALTGNIMLIAIVILTFVVILLICLHMYARWYLRRARRRHRRTYLVFYVDSLTPNAPSRGLDPSVIQSLPIFVYTSDTHPHSDLVECAVCLSEFQENETGRILPNCNHSFHVECIDMWFQSHSTCPLCRSLVEPAPPVDRRSEVVIDVCDPASTETDSGTECHHDGEEENQTCRTVCSSSSTIGLRRKPSSVGVTIEVPLSRSSGREVDSSPTSFRSSVSHLMSTSFKRILSPERKASLSSPSSDAAPRPS